MFIFTFRVWDGISKFGNVNNAMIKRIKYYYNRLLPGLESIAIRKGFLSGSYNYQKFLLLGNARVGSTLLQSYLNRHPNIYCEGEIYNTDHLKIYGKADELKQKMNNNPLQFLNTYGYPKHAKKIQFAGFKLFYSHFKTEKTKIIWDYLAENKDIKIIHIKRRNMLRNFVSLKIAAKTNEWRSFSKQSNTENKQITLSKEECVQEFEKQEYTISEMNSKFKNHKIIDVYYTDLTNNREETMNRIFKFLDTQKIRIEDTVLKKQNPESLDELVSNYQDLKNEFRDTKWEVFFEE